MWFTLLSFVGLGHTLPESQILLIPSVTPARGMLELGTRSRELEWDGSMVRAFTPHPMALGAPQIPPLVINHISRGKITLRAGAGSDRTRKMDSN